MFTALQNLGATAWAAIKKQFSSGVEELWQHVKQLARVAAGIQTFGISEAVRYATGSDFGSFGSVPAANANATKSRNGQGNLGVNVTISGGVKGTQGLTASAVTSGNGWKQGAYNGPLSARGGGR
jgi:hypothetical protein